MKFDPKIHQLRSAGTFVRGRLQVVGKKVLTDDQVETMTAETINDEIEMGTLVVEDRPAPEGQEPEAGADDATATAATANATDAAGTAPDADPKPKGKGK